MSSWKDCIYDPRVLIAIYGDDTPALDDVKFFRMHFESELKFAVEPREFPRHPPKKWLELGHNRVQINFRVADIREFRVVGFECYSRMQLRMWREGEGVRVLGEGRAFSFEILARYVFIDKIEGYQVEVGTE